MIATLALLVLGDWTAAGWMANPAPPIPAPAPVVPDAPDPDVGARPPAKRPTPPAESARPPAPAPQPHRQADNAGQVWESENLASLQAYVAARNQQLAAPPALLRYQFAPSSCSTGRCPR